MIRIDFGNMMLKSCLDNNSNDDIDSSLFKVYIITTIST
jgi:hypothetical protein